MPVAAVIAFATLALAILVQTATIAYFLGRLTQRVQSLEGSDAHDSQLSAKVVALEVEMKHANGNLEKMERTISGMSRQLATLATKGGFQPFLTDQPT